VFGFEIVQALMSTNFSVFNKNSLVFFSMINKAYHSYLYDTICNTVLFEWRPKHPLHHYQPRNIFFREPTSDGRESNLYVALLPHGITHLSLTRFNQLQYLPPSITHLTMETTFNGSVQNIPSSVTHLTFENGVSQSVDNLPSSITHLTFGDTFNQPVDHLGAGLTHLTLGLISINLLISFLQRLLVFILESASINELRIFLQESPLSPLEMISTFHEGSNVLPLDIDSIKMFIIFLPQ
jgi:hypothetical protein